MQTAFAQIASQVLMPQWKCMHNYSKVKSFRDDAAKVKENRIDHACVVTRFTLVNTISSWFPSTES